MEKKQPDQKGAGSRSGQSGTQKGTGSTQRSSGQDEKKLHAGSTRKTQGNEDMDKSSSGRSSRRSEEDE